MYNQEQQNIKPIQVHFLQEYQQNGIKVQYRRQLLEKFPKEIVEKILRIMCRISVDGGVWISNGAWKDLHFVNVMDFKESFIEKWLGIQSLGLIGNEEPKLAQQISNIRYQNLIHLNLQFCGIESLQMLSTAYMPKLTIIQLSDNYISSIKSLRRSYWPQLQSIQLYNNCIYDYFVGSRICQAQWPQLKYIYFGSRYQKAKQNNSTTIHFYQMGYYLKFVTVKLTKILLSYELEQKFKNLSKYHILKKKYLSLQDRSLNMSDFKNIINGKKQKIKNALSQHH